MYVVRSREVLPAASVLLSKGPKGLPLPRGAAIVAPTKKQGAGFWLLFCVAKRHVCGYLPDK